jgi:hypothetical protein
LFSKLKFVTTQNYIKFRQFFKADYKSGFAVRANTFDNVTGTFPIAFTVWDLNGKPFPQFIEVDIHENGTKRKFWDDFDKSINHWIKQYALNSHNSIGFMVYTGTDFNRLHIPYIMYNEAKGHLTNFVINSTNLIETSIYFAVRLCIEPTWLNDRDQFLYPNEKWKMDSEFQNDCLAFTLFHGQNRIKSSDGTNHWIPFTEQEVSARDKFESSFMANFMANKKAEVVERGGGGGGGRSRQINMFMAMEPAAEYRRQPRKFSQEAGEVFDAGRELWKYYHSQKSINVNASLYDIRAYFQGRNEAGKMNSASEDEKYTELIGILRDKLKFLAKKIEPKVYEYGFLKN